MTTKSRDKARARALQEETGWSYAECLRLVREMSEDQIDKLIENRRRLKVIAPKVAATMRRLGI